MIQTRLLKISHYLPQKIIIKRKNPFIHGTLLIRKSLIEEMGLYDENFYYSQDYKLFYDLIKKGNKVGVLKKPLYKLNTKNNISSKRKAILAYYANCVKKILPLIYQMSMKIYISKVNESWVVDRFRKSGINTIQIYQQNL